MTYPVDYVDKGLSITLPKTIDHTGRLLVREYCLDKGGKFILGDGATDQLLQWPGWQQGCATTAHSLSTL